jgi:uncharacterized protein YidB (DUF937 family)
MVDCNIILIYLLRAVARSWYLRAFSSCGVQAGFLEARWPMGILDAILGMAGGDSSQAGSAGTAGAPSPAGAQQEAPPHRGLIEAAMEMMTNRFSGGLGGLLEKFKSAGLGAQVASWVGSGPNQPVSPDQVHSALGASQITQLAQKLGIPPEQVTGQLAKIFPALVDHVTPEGQVPQDHRSIESALAMVKQKLSAAAVSYGHFHRDSPAPPAATT